MKNVIQQIFSLVLPATALVAVPVWWIEENGTIHATVNFYAGMALVLLGLAIMAIRISALIKIGKATLAPWSPPKRLVIKGPCRYARNPMIAGLTATLLEEALAVVSRSILPWAGASFVINIIYFVVYEEPGPERRFEEDYREYKKHVSMWLPRRSPYYPVQRNQS